MFGSYGSYSSVLSSNSSFASQPLDISYNMSTPSRSCAYPSWPRRSSLSDSDSSSEERPTSYLSDDDLLFLPDPFDQDDAHSIASSEGVSTPPAVESPNKQPMLVDEAAMRREYVRQVMLEKERRRRQQLLKAKKLAGPSKTVSKKSPSPSKSKLSSMTAINEIGQ